MIIRIEYECNTHYGSTICNSIEEALEYIENLEDADSYEDEDEEDED